MFTCFFQCQWSCSLLLSALVTHITTNINIVCFFAGCEEKTKNDKELLKMMLTHYYTSIKTTERRAERERERLNQSPQPRSTRSQQVWWTLLCSARVALWVTLSLKPVWPVSVHTPHVIRLEWIHLSHWLDCSKHYLSAPLNVALELLSTMPPSLSL